ncbi:MAG: protease complex subunit PrcB family protein [Eubacteriales bacterium]|nr:protease complex subunit PrcB family protein [Eubacteriales bacterium]
MEKSMRNRKTIGRYGEKLWWKRGKTGIFFLWMTVMVVCVGCEKKEKLSGEREKVDYVLCKESQLPKEVKSLLEEKKEKPGNFTYQNAMYLYVIICYGKKPYGGYSVRVEECSKTKKALFVRTQLMGPEVGEPTVEAETFPWLVMRCPRMNLLCIIDS